MPKVIEATIEVKIPFHDVDPAGVVWHGHYFKYFENARCALLDRIRYSYSQMAESGYVWPVVDVTARFTRPIHFDQQIRVTARLREWEYRLKIDYTLNHLDGQELGRGMTVQVPVELSTREMVVGSPTILMERVSALLGEGAQDG